MSLIEYCEIATFFRIFLKIALLVFAYSLLIY